MGNPMMPFYDILQMLLLLKHKLVPLMLHESVKSMFYEITKLIILEHQR